ncbi:MAG TPA: serine/threonine-protein kinase [Kofleriaceae bacterium]|nr:serine/threonine-protein kinase [Kofleriaceae bacterium]
MVAEQIRLTDRYVLCGELGSGGMASVHVGRLLGSAAFARTVAIKRLHVRFAEQPEFRLMLADEAHLAARVRHANVVQMLEVLAAGDELFLVMEYVDGISLGQLLAHEPRVAAPIAAAIVRHVLDGLHAAHEATDATGAPLEIVHRDISPENILVGADGFARVLDFGIAKARSRLHTTRNGEIKGRLAYMAPEQLSGRVTRQSDIFAASVILWECLVGRALFRGDDDGETIGRVLATAVESPCALAPAIPAELGAIAMRGLARDPAARWQTAREMALAIEACAPLASSAEIAACVERLGAGDLARRRTLVRDAEAIALEGPTTVAAAVPRSAPAQRRHRRVIYAVPALALAAAAVFALAPKRDATAELVPPSPAAIDDDVPAPTTEPVTAPMAARTAAPVPAKAPPKSKSCDPPYRLGPLGEKVWLKSCL